MLLVLTAIEPLLRHILRAKHDIYKILKKYLYNVLRLMFSYLSENIKKSPRELIWVTELNPLVHHGLYKWYRECHFIVLRWIGQTNADTCKYLQVLNLSIVLSKHEVITWLQPFTLSTIIPPHLHSACICCAYILLLFINKRMDPRDFQKHSQDSFSVKTRIRPYGSNSVYFSPI